MTKLMLELGHTSMYVLHALGVTLLAARLLHGYALSFTTHFAFGRLWGATLTFGVLLASALLCAWQGIRGISLVMR